MNNLKLLFSISVLLIAATQAYAQKSDVPAVQARHVIKIPDNELSEIELKEFEEKILMKTEDLGYYLQVIAGKNSSYQDVMSAIDLACGLFINENAKVGVSANSGNSKYFKIREYLNRLRTLNYARVEITWYEIGYVSRLRRDVDGKYYGTVTISQRFKGYADNQPVYEDITTKHIQVVLEQLETKRLQNEKYWDVKLGDISVVEML